MQNKKKQFVLILFGIIMLIILSIILQSVFVDKTSRFGLSAGIFFLSVFCLFSTKNSLKPTESFGTRNSLKVRCEKKGKLNENYRIC